ncbi:hypothetical protein VTH82DRAFT_6684 [Thermothelomyces myriococcoides]
MRFLSPASLRFRNLKDTGLKRMATTTQLPPLPETERLAPACIRILGGNPGKFTLQGTNTYLLGAGPSRILIDTGEGKPSWLAALRRVLSEEGASVACALVTHRHHDHTGGIADLLRAWPGTPVHKHRPEPEPGATGLLDIADGQQFSAEGVTLTAVHTPGHTEDHMVFFWEEENALFTGDNVLGHGTSVFEDLGLYVASLERMRTLFSTQAKAEGKEPVAYPGHGAVVRDGPGKIEEYIRHRAQREMQVLQALCGDDGDRNGGSVKGRGEGGKENGHRDGWTVTELVRNIYRDVPESLHPAAAGGVVQVLQKLQREGKVVAVGNGERWRPASGSGRSAL